MCRSLLDYVLTKFVYKSCVTSGRLKYFCILIIRYYEDKGTGINNSITSLVSLHSAVVAEALSPQLNGQDKLQISWVKYFVQSLRYITF